MGYSLGEVRRLGTSSLNDEKTSGSLVYYPITVHPIDCIILVCHWYGVEQSMDISCSRGYFVYKLRPTQTISDPFVIQHIDIIDEFYNLLISEIAPAEKNRRT
jgi:hypothetical protein